MQNLDQIAEELFNKVRGRFPSVTIGDAEGNVTNEPKLARYFDFDFMNEGRPVGKVSISLDDKAVAVVYGEDLVANESDLTKNNWYEFLKELRMFARKRALTFDTRDITKSNLNSRDYKFLATNRNGEDKMNESKLYGTSRVSYQDFDGARLMIKHTESVNSELAAGRTQKIGAIYVESAEGERFKYPYKHLSGARAMARHVSEGGKPFDDFGNYIVGLSEELAKLRKFKTYMGRSAVMAESLAGYMDVVRERISTVKKTIESLQKPNYYKETVASFEAPMLEDVPEDVAENWIDQLTIKQFNEELADVFPYIYKLVSEATRAQELTAEDIVDEAGKLKGGADDPCWKGYKMVGTKKKGGKEVPNCVPREEMELESMFDETLGQFAEGKMSEIDIDLQTLANRGDEEDLIAALQGDLGPGTADVLQNMMDELKDELASKGMNDVMNDEDKMIEMLWDKIVDEYGIAESADEMDPDGAVQAALEKFLATNPKNGDALQAFHHKAVMDKNKELDDYLTFLYDYVADQTGAGGTEELGVYDEMLDMLHQMMADKGWSEGDDDTMDVKINSKGQLSKDDGTEEPKEKKTPLGEFILSYFDRETGQFPKGETAVLTMVEKDYGEQYIEPAKAFIAKVYEVTEQYREPEDPYMERMRELAGLR